ncbi:MAG: hypothetical protein M3440_12535, partial [Chloroflexota bacterium]|nr:hypothetical protein [Chloroflexota bacterium]
EALATGDLLAGANATLANLFNAKKIAEEMNLGGAIIAGIQAQIDAQQDEVNAIGAAMGTEVVQGLAEALASGEVAEQLADFRAGLFSGFDLGNIADSSSSLDAAIAKLQTMVLAAQQIGDTATADTLTAQLIELQAEAAIVNQIIGTDAVQAWQAQEDAATAAAIAAREWADTFDSISDTGGLSTLQQEARDAELSLRTAQLQGADAATLAELQANYDEAIAQVIRFEDAMDTAIAAGLYTQQQLIEIAAQGGESLATVLASGNLSPASIQQLAGESAEALQTILDAGLLSPAQAAELAGENAENLQAVLASGILSPAQIDQFVATADEATREILAAFFGEEYIAGIEDRLNDIDAATYTALTGMVAQGFLSGQDLVNAVADGLASGRLSVQQAMELIGGDLESISDDNAIAVLNTYEQLGQDLAEAYASGDEAAIAASQAAWDEFIAYLTTVAAASGMSVEEVIANFEKLEAAANKTERSVARKSMASGSSPSAGGGGGGGAADGPSAAISLILSMDDPKLAAALKNAAGLQELAYKAGEAAAGIHASFEEGFAAAGGSSGSGGRRWESLNATLSSFSQVAEIVKEFRTIEAKARAVTPERAFALGQALGAVSAGIEQGFRSSSKNAQSMLLSNASGVGENMSAGLAAGIRGGASDVIGAAVSVAQAAIKAAQKELDIKSPSGVFEDIGEMVAVGFSDGIERGMRDIPSFMPSISILPDVSRMVTSSAAFGGQDVTTVLSETQFDRLESTLERATRTGSAQGSSHGISGAISQMPISAVRR